MRHAAATTRGPGRDPKPAVPHGLAGHVIRSGTVDQAEARCLSCSGGRR